MVTRSPGTASIESLFDVNEPYLYLIVLPALILLALGFRGEAAVFTLGAVSFVAVAFLI